RRTPRSRARPLAPAVSRSRPRRRPDHALVVRRQQLVQIAVEDRRRIAGLVAGAVVLHHLVGVEDIASDLIAPARRDVLALDTCVLFGAALQLELEQARAEDAHRALAIAALRPLVLAGDD